MPFLILFNYFTISYISFYLQVYGNINEDGEAKEKSLFPFLQSQKFNTIDNNQRIVDILQNLKDRSIAERNTVDDIMQSVDLTTNTQDMHYPGKEKRLTTYNIRSISSISRKRRYRCLVNIVNCY